jgi:hypothetical protein
MVHWKSYPVHKSDQNRQPMSKIVTLFMASLWLAGKAKRIGSSRCMISVISGLLVIWNESYKH